MVYCFNPIAVGIEMPVSIEPKRRMAQKRHIQIDAANDLARVPLTHGQFAIIDIADVPLVSGRNWQAVPRQNREKYYAITSGISMHRHLLGVTNPKLMVDHLNGNTLDNRRSNLRIATNSENQRNRGRAVQANNKSGVRGVFWEKQSGRWHAEIKVNGKLIRLGRFRKIEAAKAAREAGEVAYWSTLDRYRQLTETHDAG